jgi:carbon-monoxide dehydrogenase large subunit
VVRPGQGHATFLAQIVSDTVGIGMDKIMLAPSDSETTPWGLGMFASRGAAVLRSACGLAAQR